MAGWVHQSREKRVSEQECATGKRTLRETRAKWTKIVNTTPHRAHFTHANIFSRVAEGLEPGSPRVSPLKKSHPHPRRSCFMRSPCCLTSRLFHFHNTHPLYYFPRTVVISAIHTFFEDSLVVCLEQGPLTGYEPNVTVEASSTQVSPMLLPWRRTSFGSAKNSGEDVTLAPMSSEVDERQSVRMLVSPLFRQKREASAAPARIYHSDRENSMSRSSHVPVTEKPVAIYLHDRKASRDPTILQESYSAREKEFLPSIEKFGITLIYEQIKQPKENRH